MFTFRDNIIIQKLQAYMGSLCFLINQCQSPRQKQSSIIERRSNVSAMICKKIQTKELNDNGFYKQLFRNCLKDKALNRALGCLFGAFIGDALGAFCEFSRDISQTLIKQVMKMQGGGTYGLKPGQFTDDSELACHLLLGLLSFDPQQSLEKQQIYIISNIAVQYVKWIESRPFDVGMTCRKGITQLKHHISRGLPARDKLEDKFKVIYEEVMNENSQSQSNGSLMRIAPMAVFFTAINKQPSDHWSFIKNQIKLVHPKPILQQAGALWVSMLFKVINRENNNASTFQHIFTKVEQQSQSQSIKEWFDQAKKEKMSSIVNIGWAKIAWSYGMNILWELRKIDTNFQFDDQFFKEKISEVIKCGGDTDTNAAIVGGLLGAIVGFNSLPENYLKKMINLNMQEQRNASQNCRSSRSTFRPQIYEPYHALIKVLDLFKLCSEYRQKTQQKQ